MTKLDPIIAVGDVDTGAKWYREVFDFTQPHGGNKFCRKEPVAYFCARNEINNLIYTASPS